MLLSFLNRLHFGFQLRAVMLLLGVGSKRTGLLAALKQAYWQRWNKPIGNAGISPLAMLEQAYWQRWNRPINTLSQLL